MQRLRHSKNSRWYLQYQIHGRCYLDKLPNFESLGQNSELERHECFHLTSNRRWKKYKHDCVFTVLVKSQRLIKFRYSEQGGYQKGTLCIHFSGTKQNDVRKIDWNGNEWKKVKPILATSMPAVGREVDPPRERNSHGRNGHAGNEISRRKRDRKGDQERNTKLGEGGERYVENVLKNEEHQKGVMRVAKYNDDLGYDIKYICRDTKCRISGPHQVYVEVKTTNGNITVPFHISPKQLKVAHEHGDHYVIYRVHKNAGKREHYRLTGNALNQNGTKWRTFDRDNKPRSTLKVKVNSYLVSP